METKKLSLYHIIRPAKKVLQNPPALFMFHGYGSNEEDLFAFADQLPDEFIIISVRAPYIMDYQSYAWYAIDFDKDGTKTYNVIQAIESRDKILNFIDECCKIYNINTEKISLFGFSQGAILSYALGVSHPEKIKNIVALSGFMDDRFFIENYRSKDFSHLDIYASHGTEDDVIPLELARLTKEKLSELGIRHSFEEFCVGHTVSMDNFMSLKNWLYKKI